VQSKLKTNVNSISAWFVWAFSKSENHLVWMEKRRGPPGNSPSRFLAVTPLPVPGMKQELPSVRFEPSSQKLNQLSDV
jgi:hypothetical protein